ncbi:carboxymuconolactone decarboxylase family protein, partial [Phenylobacterium sp.]|uniref:carboxymuconolactone decarboxylase family protein n=1 Tax=Phenylobacterium sp. TaxID=1871053 RepID=UPI00260028B2
RRSSDVRLREARYPPVTDAELTDLQREVLELVTPRARPLNLFRTVLRAPAAMRSLLALGAYITSQANDLPRREKELVILRIAFLCRAGYGWAQHQALALHAGLGAEEIARVKLGPAASEWRDADRALLRACDELHADQFVRPASWADLCRHFSDKQRMDLVFTAGHYTQTCMILNTFGVQPEPALAVDPDLSLPQD